MPAGYDSVMRELQAAPRRWLVTGVAGFIGSHLAERLLSLDQIVVGLDNFSTGFRHNLEAVQRVVSPQQWTRFSFVEGDCADLDVCRSAVSGIDFVLHQAALGSVPRSLADPLSSHRANVDGFITMLEAARAAGVKKFVYASSSSVYGDHPDLPKCEDKVGTPLSPYAATKAIDEVYAKVWSSSYQLPTIGLRYFNVFGPRQDPEGAYAAVIPRWISCILKQQPCVINGDGETSRDFCYIENAIQANILATQAPAAAYGRAFNIACGARTSLNTLHEALWQGAKALGLISVVVPPKLDPFRAGDVRHSLADVTAAQKLLGFVPDVSFEQGISRLLAIVAKSRIR